jgi:hypothetical protein
MHRVVFKFCVVCLEFLFKISLAVVWFFDMGLLFLLHIYVANMMQLSAIVFLGLNRACFRFLAGVWDLNLQLML